MNRANLGLSHAIRFYTLQGYVCSIPLSDTQDYDLIVEKSGYMFRVQCRTTFHKPQNNYVVNLRVCGGNKSGQKIKTNLDLSYDLLYILDGDNRELSIPKLDLKNLKTGLTITQDIIRKYGYDGGVAPVCKTGT